MIDITIQSKEVCEGFEISSHMKGNASAKELRSIITLTLKAFAESADETIVICAMEDFVKERLGIKDE